MPPKTAKSTTETVPKTKAAPKPKVAAQAAASKAPKAAPKSKAAPAAEAESVPAEALAGAGATDGAAAKAKVRHTVMSNYNLKSYIYKLLRQLNEDAGISTEAKHVVNELCRDFIKRVITITNGLRMNDGKATLTDHHVQTAVRVILSSEGVSSAMEASLARYKEVQEAAVAAKAAAEASGEKAEIVRAPLNRKIGLTFAVSRICDIASHYKTSSKQSPKAHVALTAAVEYLTTMILTDSIALLEKRKTITTRDVKAVIGANAELQTVFSHTVVGGGESPNFESSRQGKAKSSKIVVEKRPYEYLVEQSDEQSQVLDSISRYSIRKLCYRAGMIRVSTQCIDESKRIMFDLLQPLASASSSLASNLKRKTVYWYDLQTVLESHGLPVIVNTMSSGNTVGSSFNKCPQPPPSKKTGETARKLKVGTRAVRLIKFYQKNSNSLFMPKATFKSLVNAAINNSEIRLSRPFLEQLQLYIESVLVKILSHASDIALNFKRDTVTSDLLNLSYKYYKEVNGN